jgi:hypothetical protein
MKVKQIIFFGVLALLLLGGLVFAEASGVIPINNSIELKTSQKTVLQKSGVTSINVEETFCETKECKIGNLAYCTAKVLTSSGEPLQTIMFAKCECEQLQVNGCASWHYFDDKEIMALREAELNKIVSRYANRLMKDEEPKQFESIVVVAASVYEIKGE